MHPAESTGCGIKRASPAVRWLRQVEKTAVMVCIAEHVPREVRVRGKLHASTRAGASVEFKTTARAIAIVGRKGPNSGKAKIYVDGVYVQTIDLYRSSTQSKVVVFNKSWSTNGLHSVKLVVVGTSGRPKVEVDAFPILR